MPYADLCPGREGGPGEGVGEGAHAADRNVPVAGTATDDVVEEAAVLEQGRVVRVGEGADQGVGENDSAYEVVAEVLLNGDTDGLLEERPPGLLVTDPCAQRVPGGQGFGERREDPLRDASRHAVEALPRLVLPVRSGERGEGVPGAVPADEQSGGAAAAHGRGVRGDGPLAYGEVQTEIADDLPRQQGHEVRVARQAGVDSGEGTGGDGRSPGGGEAFQDQDGLSGAGEVGGGDETVVATAHDHRVIAVGCVHGPS